MSWKKLQTFVSIYFRGKSYFENDGTENYLVFQPRYRYFKQLSGVGNGSFIYFWKSKGLSDEKVNSIAISNHIVTLKLSYYGTKTRVEFSGSCLRQDKITYDHGKIVNIYIVYEISKNYNISDYPRLEKFLLEHLVSLKRNWS